MEKALREREPCSVLQKEHTASQGHRQKAWGKRGVGGKGREVHQPWSRTAQVKAGTEWKILIFGGCLSSQVREEATEANMQLGEETVPGLVDLVLVRITHC